MKERLSSIIARLEAGEAPSGEPLAYAAIARELFPVAHLFESVGFMTVGKEIAHVERALRDLEPERPSSAVRSSLDRPPGVRSAPTVTAPTPPGGLTPEGEATDEEPTREPIPQPILAGGFLFVVAVTVAMAMILEVGPFSPRPEPTPVPPTPRPLPSPTPQPQPTAVRDRNAPPTTRERLSDALSQARLALLHGELDEAVKYLSIAALIDRNDTSVVETAERVVDQLIRDANSAADETRWDDAAAIAERARTVATRFGLDPERIDEAQRRHAEMERYRIVEPEETGVLRASTGKRVEVRLANGSVVVGRIVDIDGQNLVLSVDDDVGGGVVSFTDDIPLVSIRVVKIWED